MSMSTYRRYVALGDSQTEGLWDGDDETGLRGWADRLAEQLAELNPDLRYANLAVRGKLAHEVRAEQLDAALALQPDLATVVAGMNDLLRPGFDADAVASELEQMFAALTEAGTRVATLTFPNVAKIVPIARPLTHRVVSLNARIHEAATRHGVAILETFHHSVTTDPRIWSPDRLHANPLGHERIAAGMAYALDLPGSSESWSEPLPPPPPSGTMHSTRTELWWLASFVGPWIGRRVRGRSSGDGRSPKRPDLAPAR
ncbi:SGNH/GDSL hydrolase family protein [Haloechinothrix sp. LS1_15]|uniref:SGNH/GDSL hydrolase family protein n=1 Tax=Haloechinothrix sp. LS1_15 TaxID=2652248 RepID=UPI002947A30D|nr:SGNH/GDSL hydrolase family protein [Haloechinothrix sp. LS1_15]MDV6013772.1 SGNH/GDSL hydrolase family protein [Haloechinothrix sp. LS1_15]